MEIAKKRLRIVESLSDQPTISILLPVYNTPEHLLQRCLDSVKLQTYTKWELCIADDASERPYVKSVIERAARNDSRIKFVARSDNGHISAASNSALELATGRFCALLDHDDELATNALLGVVQQIARTRDAEIIYSDEDKIDESGRRFDPTFKPDWSRDLFYSTNYLNHLTVIQTELIRDAGAFRIGFEGSQDYDLLLRCVERVRDDQIAHVPQILYHWRAIRGSTALERGAKSYARESTQKALAEHFERVGLVARVEPAHSGASRVSYLLNDEVPRVTLILFGGFVSEANEIKARWRAVTHYDRIEIFNTPQSESISASLNAAAKGATGEVICFAHSYLEPTASDWLSGLTGFAIQKEIGAVGGKIVDEDGDVQEGGEILDPEKGVRAAYRGRPSISPGNLGRNLITGNYSSVSCQLMAIRNDVFDRLGGFDDTAFPDALFGADLCLRLADQRLRVVFYPHAEARFGDRRAETILSPTRAEIATFRHRWSDRLACDPFHNPNLEENSERFRHVARSQKP